MCGPEMRKEKVATKEPSRKGVLIIIGLRPEVNGDLRQRQNRQSRSKGFFNKGLIFLSKGEGLRLLESQEKVKKEDDGSQGCLGVRLYFGILKRNPVKRGARRTNLGEREQTGHSLVSKTQCKGG